jgi:hypothetical protein
MDLLVAALVAGIIQVLEHEPALSSPNPPSRQHRLPLPRLQLLYLFPQDIRLKISKCSLNPPLTLHILANRTLRPPRPSHHPGLTPNKDPPSRKECVRRDIPQRRRFQQRREVWDGLFAAIGEFDGGRLLGCAEGAEHRLAGAAEAEGEEGAEGEAGCRTD